MRTILNSPWLRLMRSLALVLGMYAVLRVLFLCWNHTALEGVGAGQIAHAFLQGLRFDLAAAVATNSPFILLTLLPRRRPPGLSYQRFLKWVFLAVNLPFLVVNLIDTEFFQFTGRRSSLAMLHMATDPGVKWLTMMFYYWPLLLFGGLVMTALFVLYGRPKSSAVGEARSASLWTWVINLGLAAGLSVVAVRGGLQHKPLSPAQAAVLNHSGLAQLALNSTFTLFRSHGHGLKRYNFFAGWPELKRQLRPWVDGESVLPAEARRDNIVILTVESLSAEYCGAGNGGDRYTPFLDSLARQSLFFAHNYANGRRSIEAMPSILDGFPSLMDLSLSESLYSDQPLLGLGTLLTPHGYTTSFFHGAKKGTMRFDVFMQTAGIQNYFGQEEYPNPADQDGDWGIFDEPYLQYAARQLTLQKPPFAALIFTLTSHHPYPIPPQYRGRFKKGTLEIHESIGYTDHALEEFFRTARQQPWYSNTLFVITGDHTQKLETPQYANPLGRYRVPLLFFHPRRTFAEVDAGRITQHVDILPSLLDYLNIRPPERLLFGRSVFRRGAGRALLHENGRYSLVRAERVLEFNPEGASHLFDFTQDPQLKLPLLMEPERFRAMRREAEAMVQYFNNGLLDRQLYDPVDPIAAVSAR